MDKSEYLIKKSELHKEAETKQSDLAKEYVLSNITVQIGEFIADHT